MEIENLKLKEDIDIMNTTISELSAILLDKFYPIGTYYETSDENFDPNTEWGGTWVQDTIGYCTVGANTIEDAISKYNLVNLQVGKTTGEAEHTLTTSEIPSHTHTYNKVYDTGTTENHFALHYFDDATWGAKVQVDSATGSTGDGGAHNNTQPSIGVVRWHRTA